MTNTVSFNWSIFLEITSRYARFPRGLQGRIFVTVEERMFYRPNAIPVTQPVKHGMDVQMKYIG